MDLPDGSVEVVGQGQLSPSTKSEIGYTFRGFMKHEEALRLRNFHDLHDMPQFLKASQTAVQWARLGPNSKKDEDPLKIITRYMEKHNKVKCHNFTTQILR